MTEEHIAVEDHTKLMEDEEEEKKEDDEDDQKLESEGWAVFRADGVEFQLNLKERVERERQDNDGKHDAEKKDDDNDAEQYFIGESGCLSRVIVAIINDLHIFVSTEFVGLWSSQIQHKAAPESFQISL